MTEITRGQFVIAAVVVAVLAFAGSRALRPEAAPVPGGGGPAVVGRDAPAGARTGDDESVAIARPPAKRIVVHVAGAVRRPGVYRLKDGQRIADAIERAGGGTRGADLDAVNLAAKARDGVQVLVPRRAAAGGAAPGSAVQGGGVAPGATAGAAPAAAGAIVDLNTATAEQLETLDGVGPATSAKILQYRAANGPFRSVDDLEQIPGIGPKKLAAIRPRARV